MPFMALKGLKVFRVFRVIKVIKEKGVGRMVALKTLLALKTLYPQKPAASFDILLTF